MAFSGIFRVGTRTSASGATTFITGELKNASSVDPDWIRDEETTGDSFGGATTSAEYHFNSQASYAALETLMENGTFVWIDHEYLTKAGVENEVSKFPCKVMVRKMPGVNATDGKRGMIVAFRRHTPGNFF